MATSQYPRPEAFLVFNSRLTPMTRASRSLVMKSGGHIMIGTRILFLDCRGLRYLLLALVGLLLICNSTTAQNATGRIIGTVTDAQGAAIAGVKGTVTNNGTKVARKTVARGYELVPGLG